jgi:hypothetical protein
VTRRGGAWSLPRFLRDEEWTPLGLVARRRMLRGVALALILTMVSSVILLALVGRR